MRSLRPAGLAAVTVMILVLTLFPVAGAETRLIMVSFSGLRSVADTIANVLLFVPFGAVAALVLRGWRPVVAGAVLSLLIEVVQLAIPGRYSSPSDLIFNTAGAAAGLMLVRGARQWLSPPRWAARLLAGAALIAALAVLAGGGLLFRPSVTSSALYGQWTADFGDMETYRGRVVSAQVADIEMPSRRIRETDALRGKLLSEAPIRVEAVAGPEPPGLAPLFSIFDAGAVEVLLIGIDGADVVIRRRLRATELRLDEPHFRAGAALADIREGDEFTLEIWKPGAESCVRVTHARSTRTDCSFGHTVGDTWALLLFPVPRPLVPLLRIVWVAALLVPAGFWIRGSAGTAGVAALLVILVLTAAPGAVGVLPTPLPQLGAAAGGIVTGYLIGRWAQWWTQARAGPTDVADTQRKTGLEPV